MPKCSRLRISHVAGLALSCLLATGAINAGTCPADGFANATDLPRLGVTLQNAGWHTTTDGDGALIVSRMPPLAATPSPAPVPSRDRETGMDTSILAEQLPRHGWEIVRAPDGVLGLYPPGATQTQRGTAPAAATRTAAPGQNRPLDALAQLGWGIRRDADGNVLLFPSV